MPQRWRVADILRGAVNPRRNQIGRGKSTRTVWRLWSRVTRTAAGSHGGKVTKQL